MLPLLLPMLLPMHHIVIHRIEEIAFRPLSTRKARPWLVTPGADGRRVRFDGRRVRGDGRRVRGDGRQVRGDGRYRGLGMENWDNWMLIYISMQSHLQVGDSSIGQSTFSWTLSGHDIKKSRISIPYRYKEQNSANSIVMCTPLPVDQSLSDAIKLPENNSLPYISLKVGQFSASLTF